jgi:hypothetical protein
MSAPAYAGDALREKQRRRDHGVWRHHGTPGRDAGGVQRYLRRLGKMPDNTDKLFVTSRDKTLLGELELKTILLNSAQRRVSEVMETSRWSSHLKMMRKKRRDLRT